REKNARGPGSHVDHAPDADIFIIGTTPILQRAIDDLWLQPERTPSRFRVPEGLSVGARTRQIHRVKLHPGRVAMTRCHPRVAACLYFRRMAPGNIGKGAGTVCCNCGVLVEPANQLRAPAQKPNRVIPLKLAPVERITVASAARWMNVFPARVA